MNIDDLGYYFDKNLDRVKSLIKVYTEITNLGKGRKSIDKTDVLRAAIVLLHSSMEDFLRNLLKIKLPTADKTRLNKIPLFLDGDGFTTRTKFELGELTQHRGKSIKEVIEFSVNQFLDRQSYNNTREISSALESIGLQITPEIKKIFPKLDLMIQRRHNIVHQADREKKEGQGYHRAKSMNLSQVNKWVNTVDVFVVEIVKQL